LSRPENQFIINMVLAIGRQAHSRKSARSGTFFAGADGANEILYQQVSGAEKA
jgi:hypothetical protein